MIQTKLLECSQKYPLRFFTNITTNISNYCLLNIKSYKNKKKFNKKIIYIDPSVMELRNSDEFSNINFMHQLIEKDQLLKNEWISIDYPCDMNEEFTDLFIQKSMDNNFKYASNLKYICALQFKFKDFKSFVKEAEKLRMVWELPDKIIGIGNMCRLMYRSNFTDNVFKYIRNNMAGHKIHFYGLSLRVLKSSCFKDLLFNNFQISVDSTKWTRPVNKELKNKYKKGYCISSNRDEFFLEYMKNLEKNGIWVEY